LPANLLSRHPAIFQFYVRETERSESLRWKFYQKHPEQTKLWEK
jgi:hypothetical protein